MEAELSLIVAVQSQLNRSSNTARSRLVFHAPSPALARLKFGSFTSPRYSFQQTSKAPDQEAYPAWATHFFHPRPAFAPGAWCAAQLQLLTICDTPSSSDTASPGRCRALQVPLTPDTPPSAPLHPGLIPPTRTAARIDAGHAAASFAHWILLRLRREQRRRVPAAQP